MDFVDGTLHRRQADIQRLYIYWREHLNEDRVNSWITSAIRHNVQQLILKLTQHETLNIPQSLFTCESLISLEIRISSKVHSPNYVSLPKLKCLELEGIEFSGEDWDESLFSKCPALEILSIQNCLWLDFPYICISTPTLKSLTFNIDPQGFVFTLGDGLEDCTLEVDAPNLEFFCYNGSIAHEYVLTTFPLLVKADVGFDLRIFHDPSMEERIDNAAAISQFLRALVNVKCLSVSDDTLQALFLANDLLEKLPTFHNAKKLTISEEVTNDKALVAFLKATPNLESLVFDKGQRRISDAEEEDYVSGSDADDEEEDYVTGSDADDEEQDDVIGSDADADVAEGEDNYGTEDDDWTLNVVIDPECLFLYLQSVNFAEFIGNPMEMRWVKLILKNAKALQTMSVSYCDHSDLLNKFRKEELIAEITSLPRASASCVFKFHYRQDTLVMNKWNRKEDQEIKWKFEADMLSSFEEDPEICMKAVCALHRQHITKDEKSYKGLFPYNDVLRIRTLAKLLMDDDCKCGVMKSVKELETLDSEAVEDCKRLAKSYSKQLFSVYQNGNDPFFLPATTVSDGNHTTK